MAKSRLNYRESGTGTPLVLVHGFPFDSAIWKQTLDGLSDVAHVLAPDLPGFGGSQGAGQGDEVSIEGYADALAKWVSDLQLGRIMLAGHSMGGYVTFAFARRHPEMLIRLIPVCTRPGADSDTAREGRYKLAAAVKEKGPQAVVDAMMPKLFAEGTEENNATLVDQVRDNMLHQPSASLQAAILAMAARPDATPSLGSIEVPVLVVSGAEDAIIPADEADAMVTQIKGARPVIIQNAGHLPMLENPAEFNAALRDFLGTIL